METPEIAYGKDDYTDILDRDGRYDPRAYDFVIDVVGRASEEAKGHVSGQRLLDFFRDLALDAYGPMAYATLSDWGVKTCEDVGEIVMNLCDSKRIGKTETDSRADFIGGFDFRREFLDLYSPQ